MLATQSKATLPARLRAPYVPVRGRSLVQEARPVFKRRKLEIRAKAALSPKALRVKRIMGEGSFGQVFEVCAADLRVYESHNTIEQC